MIIDNIIHNLIYSFLEEIIDHHDNYPTKISILLYSYFQMFYNISSLCNQNIILSTDRVSMLNSYYQLKSQIQHLNNKDDILKNMLYYGHIGFLSSLYSDFDIHKYKISNFGIKDIKMSSNILQQIYTWAGNHYKGKLGELDKLHNEKYTNGILADHSGNFDYIPENPNKWVNLIVPNGLFNENEIPIIDINANTTYTIQSFEHKNWWLNSGFAIYPSKEPILNIDDKLSNSWENGFKNQCEKILNIYQNLDDRKKVISEFFSFDSKETITIAGFWIIIAMMLSAKNNQTIENDIIMFFILSAGLFDSSISAWTYKFKHEQPRPISIIRHYYKNESIQSWNITKSAIIDGKQWLPYQKLTSVSPSHPDLGDINTIFSTVAGSILEWWFDNKHLYHSFKLFTLPNPHFISPILNKQYKSFSIGEFCIEKGTSMIEQNSMPSQTIVLKYHTLKDLIDDVSISSVYGGISWPESVELSSQIGCYVFDKIKNMIINVYKIKSPY